MLKHQKILSLIFPPSYTQVIFIKKQSPNIVQVPKMLSPPSLTFTHTPNLRSSHNPTFSVQPQPHALLKHQAWARVHILCTTPAFSVSLILNPPTPYPTSTCYALSQPTVSTSNIEPMKEVYMPTVYHKIKI